jgi:hypothetical protein
MTGFSGGVGGSSLVRCGRCSLGALIWRSWDGPVEGQAFRDAPQHVGGVDRLGQSSEVMATVARFIEQIDGGGLSGE